jgi:hypothetical protein
LATARTRTTSGPGNASAYTSVYLKWQDDSKDYEILQLSETGSLDLKLNWTTPSDLVITYDGQVATVWLQVSKYGKVTITLHDGQSDRNAK